MPNVPDGPGVKGRTTRWKQDFPVPSAEDSYATRREFTKFLGLTSFAFLAGTFVAAARKLWKQATSSQSEAIAVATLEEIPAGGSKLFRYPSADDPCILLRLAPDKFVAFNQNCTHLNCPVHFDTETYQLACPCHHGFFNAEDGKAVAGPPRRSLAALAVTVRDGQVWVQNSKGNETA
ncbi:MAG TPA: Rieske (2Fe-2S) protein [Terriglobia bacterium]|nr:Rieske (2Fe-2S) protein [Terriglobia bacterium]